MREVAVAQTRTVERIPVQTLDETVDVQTLAVGACTTTSLQPEKATGFTAQAPTQTVNNLSIAYSVNTMQSTLMIRMCVSFITEKPTRLR